MELLGTSTLEVGGGCGRINIAKDTRRTVRPNADLANRNPRKQGEENERECTVRLFRTNSLEERAM
jgi:hypothetical protein